MICHFFEICFNQKIVLHITRMACYVDFHCVDLCSPICCPTSFSMLHAEKTKRSYGRWLIATIFFYFASVLYSPQLGHSMLVSALPRFGNALTVARYFPHHWKWLMNINTKSWRHHRNEVYCFLKFLIYSLLWIITNIFSVLCTKKNKTKMLYESWPISLYYKVLT